MFGGTELCTLPDQKDFFIVFNFRPPEHDKSKGLLQRGTISGHIFAGRKLKSLFWQLVLGIKHCGWD